MQRGSFFALFVALGSLSCSDPAPPIAEVGAHYTISGNCPSTSSNGGIGATKPLTEGGPVGVPELPTTNGYPTKKGGPVIDGLEGPNVDGPEYEVSCKISGDGALTVQADLSGQNVSPSVIGNRLTSISLTGTLNADGAGTGQVTFFTAELQTVTSNDCVFQAVPANDGAPDMSPGQAFFTFSCPNVTMNSTVQDGCNSRGTLVLAECQQN